MTRAQLLVARQIRVTLTSLLVDLGRRSSVDHRRRWLVIRHALLRRVYFVPTAAKNPSTNATTTS